MSTVWVLSGSLLGGFGVAGTAQAASYTAALARGAPVSCVMGTAFAEWITGMGPPVLCAMRCVGKDAPAARL